MRTASLLIAITCAGCVSADLDEISRKMYNIEDVGVSEFDGQRHVRLSNVPCSSATTNFFFDLYQDTKLAKSNSVVIKAKLMSPGIIASGPSLHFNVDGEILDVASLDDSGGYEEVFSAQYSPGYVGGGTYVAPYYSPALNASTRVYRLSNEEIEKIARAEKIVVRLDLKNEHIDGRCDPRTEKAGKYRELVEKYSGKAGFTRFNALSKTL